jgi:hypothetical protein
LDLFELTTMGSITLRHLGVVLGVNKGAGLLQCKDGWMTLKASVVSEVASDLVEIAGLGGLVHMESEGRGADAQLTMWVQSRDAHVKRKLCCGAVHQRFRQKRDSVGPLTVARPCAMVMRVEDGGAGAERAGDSGFALVFMVDDNCG